MRIYFAGSIRGGRADAARYSELIAALKQHGEVLTEHIGLASLESGTPDAAEAGMDDRSIHDRDVAWLEAADVLVAEVTVTSMGVGYEIGRAVAMGKPVLCLFRPSAGTRLSAMIGGCADVELCRYEETHEALAAAVAFIARFRDRAA